jgi:hypothetical protein
MQVLQLYIVIIVILISKVNHFGIIRLMNFCYLAFYIISIQLFCWYFQHFDIFITITALFLCYFINFVLKFI